MEESGTFDHYGSKKQQQQQDLVSTFQVRLEEMAPAGFCTSTLLPVSLS